MTTSIRKDLPELISTSPEDLETKLKAYLEDVWIQSQNESSEAKKHVLIRIGNMLSLIQINFSSHDNPQIWFKSLFDYKASNSVKNAVQQFLTETAGKSAESFDQYFRDLFYEKIGSQNSELNLKVAASQTGEWRLRSAQLLSDAELDAAIANAAGAFRALETDLAKRPSIVADKPLEAAKLQEKTKRSWFGGLGQFKSKPVKPEQPTEVLRHENKSSGPKQGG